MARRAAPLMAAAALCAALVPGCSREPQPRHDQLVGKWKSSRLATPLYLHTNGEWEIRTEDERVLQYGVWQLQGRHIVWSIRMDGRLAHDENTILSVRPGRFELRERDGSVTRFDRLD